MKFTGLFEDEILEITKILDQEGISYHVEKDHFVEEANANSLKDDLRYRKPPNLSLNILAISIDESAFSHLSKDAKMHLEKLGIMNIDNPPSEVDFKSDSTDQLSVGQINKINKRQRMEVLVHRFAVTLIFILLCFLLYTVLNIQH